MQKLNFALHYNHNCKIKSGLRFSDSMLDRTGPRSTSHLGLNELQVDGLCSTQNTLQVQLHRQLVNVLKRIQNVERGSQMKECEVIDKVAQFLSLSL